MKSSKELQFGRPVSDGQQVPETGSISFDSSELPFLEAPRQTAGPVDETVESVTCPDEGGAIRVGGLIADRYSVTDVISQSCFVATDGVDGKSVLLKVICGTDTLGVGMAAAVNRSSGVSHPSLVGVLDFHQTAHRAFVVSESVDGRSLREEIANRVERDQRFTIEEVLKVAADVCRCLKVCHTQMAHGRINVDTIFITADGCTRLADYGLPCGTDVDHAGGNGLQTPAAKANDLRDLAGVLYELLTGQRPGPSPVAPHTLRNSVPARLSQVILKSLSGRRIGPTADPKSFERRLTRASKRKTHPAVTVICVVLACVATAAVISSVSDYQARQAEREVLRLARKPEYARRLGEVRQMQQQAEVLMTSLASESKRLHQEVEKWEKELANAEDGNKPTQAENARQKLEKLRPQSDMAERIHEYWSRHANRQQWTTGASGFLSAAEMLAKDGDYDEAVDSLKSANDIFSGLVSWHSSIERRLREMDRLSARLDERASEYSSLGFLPYSEPQQQLQKAQVSLISGDGSDAEDAFQGIEQLLGAIDELMPLRLELEQLRQRPRVVSELPELEDQYSVIDELLESGDLQLAAGNAANASTQYSQAKESYREMPVKTVETLLSMFDASRNPREALHLLDEALLIPLEPEHDQQRREQVYASRSELRIELGELRLAIDDLNMVISLNPGNASFYAKRADLWNELRDTEAAITDYEQAISLDDDQIDAGIRLAELYAASGQSKLAVSRYGWVLARRPDDVKTRLARATISAQAGSWTDPLEDSSHVLTHDQSRLVAWQIRTMANFELRNIKDAVEDASRLIEFASDYAMGYTYRAAANLEDGQFDAAIKDSTAAISIDPSSVWCYRIRAKARFGKGETDSAQQDYQLAMRLAAEETF